MPGFYFLFPGRATFPKSTSARAGALLLQSRFFFQKFRFQTLVPLFSPLSSPPAWYSFLRLPTASSLKSQTIFHPKAKLFVLRPQNGLGTLTNMCWLRELWCRQEAIALGVYPTPLQSRHLSPSLCSFSANSGISMGSAGEGMLKLASETCPLLRTVPNLGSEAESWKQSSPEQELTSWVSLPRP